MTVLSTEGYGNELKTSLSRVIIIIIIIVAITGIPTKSSELMILLSAKSMYSRLRYKIIEETPHIIITGTVSYIAASDFLYEFFHEDHGSQPRHTVILSPIRPDNQIENLIRQTQFSQQVYYIQGDPLSDSDLKRCQAEKAKSIIIMCNKQSGDANEEDSKTILQAMVIKKYLKSNNAQNVRLCMQILRPEGKTHYYLSLNRQTKNDQVICIEELKLSLLAKSCLCPGLVALISNLITSSGVSPKKSELEYEWLDEYWKGKGFEIYKTSLSSRFVGKSFSWVAANIYRNFKAILFAIELDKGENTRIFPNPGDYKIPETDKVVGYIITEDKSIADQISNYKISPEEISKKKGNAQKINAQNILGQNDTSARRFMEPTSLLDDGESTMNQKHENFSIAGEWSRIEEKCHISINRIDLSSVTFKTLEKNSLATNHILLCGLVPNLINFVLPLRAKYLTTYPPIVILHSKAPTDKQWNQICFFPEIYFVKGTALNNNDLIRANIMKASKVVILSPNVDEIQINHKTQEQDIQINENSFEYSQKTRALTRDEEDLLDARTIFKYKAINKLRPGIPIVTELVCPNNLAFLLQQPNDYALMTKYGYTQTPTFASGQIYLSSVIDSLICQAFYNSALITVLNQLLVGNLTQSEKKKDEFSNVRISNMYHLKVPLAFIEQPFEKLFNYLTKRQNILPIALYRLAGCKDNYFPYIVTNPDPQTLLTEKDQIFILAQEMPPPSSDQWGAPLEKRDDSAKNQSNFTKQFQDENDNFFLQEQQQNDIMKQEQKENKLIKNKISDVVKQLQDINLQQIELRQHLFFRQQYLLDKIKSAINITIKDLMPNNNIKRIIYDDDELVTASPVSSLNDSQDSKDEYNFQLNNK